MDELGAFLTVCPHFSPMTALVLNTQHEYFSLHMTVSAAWDIPPRSKTVKHWPAASFLYIKHFLLFSKQWFDCGK